MKSLFYLIKKHFSIYAVLLFGLLFFSIVFTLIRRYYYGEMPILQEYIFPVVMGTVFGGGIGLWRHQTIKHKQELENTLNDLNESYSCLKKTNKLLLQANKDLSETRHKLSQAQKMELIGTIASGVAHDLNNVLAASVNYPEILLLEYPENDLLCEYLEIIKKSGLKAAAIVQDLLTLARRGVPVEKVINLNDMIEESITSPEFEKIKLYHPNMELKLDLKEDIKNIIGSPLHIMKTIMNLISNAAEAMPYGGTVSIQTYKCDLENNIKGYENIQSGTYSVLCVGDTGTGIPEKDIEKIFEPFYTKKEMGRSGTGLGMAVIWGTVKDHKGFIDVKSIEGQGTKFTLYFPITEKMLDKREWQQSQPKNINEFKGHGESILVVDDLEDQRKIAKDMLSVLGYSVITASSGNEAVEYIKNNTPDLVLIDMIMSPGIDGLDTYKKMLKYNPRQKSLIISGYAENRRVKELIKLGAGKYIKKPYTLTMLGSAIKNELNKN